MISQTTVIAIVVGYLLLIYGVAAASSRGLIPARIINQPIIYVLSMGVFASTWVFYGMMDLADEIGYAVLFYYLGACSVFFLAPITMAPLAELVRRFRIPSIADLLVFRFNSQAVGTLVTLCMLIALMSLLVMQIKVVVETAELLSDESSTALSSNWIAAFYCVVLAVVASHLGSKRENQIGLLVVFAVEAVIKLFALLAVGATVIFAVFGDFAGISRWLEANPDSHQQLYQSLWNTNSHSLVVVAMATAWTLPHIFQLTIVNQSVDRFMRVVSWAFPLYMFLLALPLFPILWAGRELGLESSIQYFTLSVPMALGQQWVSLLVFVGGLAAATGALISLTLANGIMVLNHWVLPLSSLGRNRDLRRRLSWMRQTTIASLFGLSLFVYWLLGNNPSLIDLALTTFIASLQFLPGIISVIYWPQANKYGFLSGLSMGMMIWGIGLFLPVVIGAEGFNLWFGLQLQVGMSVWGEVTLLALAANILVFVLVSLLTKQTAEERYSAGLCTESELLNPVRVVLDVYSCDEIKDRLSESLGATVAETQVNRALEELGLNLSERRPYGLRRLRYRLQSNLSELMGNTVASELIDKHLPYRLPDKSGTTDINLMELQLGRLRGRLTGMAADLDRLRLYHRNTLQELPMAACSLGLDNEVMMWNRAMAELTGTETEDVVGSSLDSIAEPWQNLLAEFSATAETHRHAQLIETPGVRGYYSLHRATLYSPFAVGEEEGQVILIEDVTELKNLEHELVHSERLASVGRFAAGVAHEIGNPVTGIACLAQNLRYDQEPDEIRESADQILSQTQRISKIVQSLVGFSHRGSVNRQSASNVSLHRCAAEAIALLSLQKDKAEVTYRNLIDTEVLVLGDEQKLIQVFVNLLSNARDASAQNTEITISAKSHAGRIKVYVDDQGSGIPQAVVEQIMEPFFTTKEPGKGTGLGLAMVYSIVEEHDGHIDIVSPLDELTNKGTRIIIDLPESPSAG